MVPTDGSGPQLPPGRTAGSAAAAATTELHLHLEGSLQPQRAWALWQAAKHVPPLPSGSLLEAGPPPRWRFSTLRGFLELFGWATRLLRGVDQYAQLLEDLLEELDSEGVHYAELFVAIGQMLRTGVDPHAVLPRLAEMAAERAQAGGPEVWFVADLTRQWGVRAAEAVLDAALSLQRHRIVGLGMGGDETALRARDFRRVYRRAAENGLTLSCHAGEGTTADLVREAVEELEVSRIGHGIAAADDERLMRELREAGVVLEVCPTSNERTGAWDPQRGPHPIHRLLAHDVPVVLGTDDPGFFACTLRSERQRLLDWGIAATVLEDLECRARRVRMVPEDSRAETGRD